MFLLAASLFVFTPAGPSALAHERTAQEAELAARPLPKSIWRLDADGATTHLQSALVCPSSAGSLQRTDLVPYDGFGFDVGCSFLADGPIVVTLYLTHRFGATLQEHFDGARAAITMTYPTAKPIDGPVPMPAGDLKFLSARYQIGDLESGLWAADVAGWTLKFRVSFDPRKRADAIDAMSQLAGGAQRTAGDHLSQCAGAAPVARKGEQITDRELLTRLSLIAGMSEQAGSENVTPLPKNERWCAEDTARSREAPMIYWRNILNDGADGPLDRLSLMTMEEPPIWLLSANAVANMLIDEKDKPGPLIHHLTEARGDKTFLFAYYRGRPDLNTLAPFVRNVVLGNTKPIASFDAKTNTITLSPTGKPDS